jgi:hypothetical protein
MLLSFMVTNSQKWLLKMKVSRNLSKARNSKNGWLKVKSYSLVQVQLKSWSLSKAAKNWAKLSQSQETVSMTLPQSRKLTSEYLWASLVLMSQKMLLIWSWWMMTSAQLSSV